MVRYRVEVAPAFDEDLAAIGPDGYDWTASLNGVKWYLARNPEEVGKRTQDTAVRIYLHDRPQGLPGVFFLIEDDLVTLIHARSFAPPAP